MVKKSAHKRSKRSRRSLLTSSPAATGLTTAAGPQHRGTNKFTIVGAGIAGLYAAWRLVVQSKYATPSDICILEMTNRLGGRLDTFTFPDGTAVELGGMRFNTAQPLVTKLVNQFRLNCLDFPETDNRLYYLRSKQIWQQEMSSPGMLPYVLGRREQLKTPDDLLSWAVGEAIGKPAGWEKWSPRQWHRFVERHSYWSSRSNPVRVYRGVRYSNIGFWDLLRDQLTNEGYRYVTDGGGYDSNTINWNSAIAMPYMASGDYAPGMKYQRIRGGYHKLPEALGAALANAGVSIFRGTRLISFAKDRSGVIDCTFDQAGVRVKFKTEHLFLCMPPRSLELLDGDTAFISRMRRKKYFDRVIRQPSFKLLFLFKDRWYQNVNIRGQSITPFGPTITDLPLRMIWYFDDPSKPYWALLASYCDMATTEFWRVMEAARKKGNSESSNPSKEMIRMARAQLQSVHDVKIPNPKYGAVFRDWGLDPFGGGYHAWAAHHSPWDTFERMLKPIGSYNVYVCGEAYSLDQGWVEGALSTVDECLYRQMGIQPYVKKTYFKSLTGATGPASTSFGLRRL